MRTTDSEHSLPLAENLLARTFSPSRPNEDWASDITCVRTLSGWLFVAVTLDLFPRKVVGWATGSTIDSGLMMRALRMAIDQRHPPKGLIQDSDRGSEFASDAFQGLLEKQGMICRMSRRAYCWDNAPVESFFGSMKAEWLEDIYANRAQATQDMLEYIEVFYNRERRHSTLGGISPFELEERHQTT